MCVCGGVWGVGGVCVVSVCDGGGGSVRGVCVVGFGVSGEGVWSVCVMEGWEREGCVT